LSQEIAAERVVSLCAEWVDEPALGGLVGRVFPGREAALQAVLEDILTGKQRAGLVPYLARLGPGGLPVLRSALQNPNSEIQLLAAEALAELGEAAALPYLSEALASHDARVSIRAARALGKLPAAVPALLGQLGHPQAVVREALVISLAAFAVPFGTISQACSDPDPRIREAGLRLLASTDHPQAGPFLIELLQIEPEVRVRCAGIEALGSVGTASVGTYIVLEEIFESGQPSERAAVTGILHRLNGRLAEPILRKALASRELWTLIYACRSLQNLGMSELVPLLSGLLSD
ncbi:unnamed protein product, partial [Phaeothamnion confervicola]